MLAHVFVYGTLKRGQCRESVWPHPPLAVRPAWVRGELYDLGPYPAMLAGTDQVLGELWSFDRSVIARVLKVLDEVEGTQQPAQANEYDRIRTKVWLFDSRPVMASTYRYAQPHLLSERQRIPPTHKLKHALFAIWPTSERVSMRLRE